jgi:hypothetical protein
MLRMEVDLGSYPVVVKESELEVVIHNLATLKSRVRIGIIMILDRSMTASLTRIRHKCA